MSVTEGSGTGFVQVPPPPEVRNRGVNLLGLNSWADALGGQVLTDVPSALAIPELMFRRHVPLERALFVWVLVLACLDLLLKRLVPGRART